MEFKNEENQKRRDFLLQIESIVRETLETQPAGDDPVRCGMALDRGVDRIEEVVAEYRAEWPELRIPRHVPSWTTSGRHG